jgi:ribonuclease BN (tRNA processing enzyme)
VSRVTFIGTSDAFGAGGRRQAAILVETRAGGLLLDCAPTTGSGLAALGIPRDAVDAVAVTHFHGDHFAGIPQLVFAAHYEDQRSKPLVVAGPPGVEARVRRAAQSIGMDLEGRALHFPLRFAELAPGRALELAGARVDAFAAYHQPDSVPHGFAVAVGARRLVYSGDTGWFDGLPGLVRGADLCICECTFHEPSFEYHLDYRRLVERAGSFACGRLVLTHLGAQMAPLRGRLELETADDGLTIEL